MPLRKPQTHDTSTGTPNASQPTGPKVQDAMREHHMRLSSPVFKSRMPVPPMREHQMRLPKSVSTRIHDVSTVHTGNQAPIRNADRTGYEHFPKPPLLVLLMSRLAQPRLDGQVPLDDSRSDLAHFQYCLSVLQWNPGPARENDTQIIPAACGRFHVILQEAGDHVPHISEHF